MTKKIVSLLVVFTLLFSLTSVFAFENSVADKFADALSTKIDSGKITASFDLSASGSYFDIPENAELKELFNSSVDFKINTITEAENKVKAKGNFTLNNATQSSVNSDLWLDMDANENFKYTLVLKVLTQMFPKELQDKFFVYDLSKNEEANALASALLSIEADNSLETQALTSALLEGVEINPIYSNNKYTVSMTDSQLKKAFYALFENLMELSAPAGDSEDYQFYQYFKASILQSLTVFKDVQIFDEKKGLVLVVTVDENNKCTDIHFEVNLNLNILEISRLFDPYLEAEIYNPDDYKAKISVEAKMNVEPLADSYKIDFPVLTPYNSVDAYNPYNDACSLGIIEGDDNIEVLYNDVKIELDDKPIMVYDRTFLPLRNLANVLGVSNENISYDERNEVVTLTYDDTKLQLTIGSRLVYVNGEAQFLDVPSFTYNDRTYLPVRFISELFGKNVGYSQTEEMQTITLND